MELTSCTTEGLLPDLDIRNPITNPNKQPIQPGGIVPARPIRHLREIRKACVMCNPLPGHFHNMPLLPSPSKTEKRELQISMGHGA